MKATTIAGAILLVVPIASAAGCGSDPNKQLKEARVEEAETMREQRVESIDQQKERQVEAIENRAEQRGNVAETLPEGSEQRAKAQVDMNEERRIFLTQAQARLQKIDARLVETQRKLQVVGGRAPTSLWDKVNLATKLRAGLTPQVNNLPQVSHQRWGEEKSRIETRIDELESTVDDAKSEVDGLTP